MELREKIARVIWEAEPESKLEHFDNLLCGPILGDLYSTADAILAIPEIAGALASVALLEGERKIFDNYRAGMGRFLKPDGRIG